MLPLSGGEPTKAVLSILEKLKSTKQQPGVPGEIGISGFAGPKTRSLLNEAWNQRADWIRGEKVEFFEGFEKIDGELSAVLVGARSADDPEEAEMMGFALRLEDGVWSVGPVEGSFNSMGLGFDKSLRTRVGELERWMAVERVTAADRLKKEALKRFKERMAKLVDPELLKSASPRKVMENFLAAARAGRTEELLVWQGVLERGDHDEIPWEEMISMTRKGMKNQDARNVWRLLNRPGVMQVLLDGEEDESEKSMLVSFLAGFSTGRDSKKLRPVIFRVRKNPEGWRVSLPSYFAKADEDQWDHWRAHQREVHFRDEVNTERMASVYEEEHAPRRAVNPAELLDRVARDLFDGTMEKSLPYLFRDPPEENKEAEEDPEDEEVADPKDVLIDEDDLDPEVEKVKRYREFAVWWAKTSGNLKGIKVGAKKVYQSGDLALGVLEILPKNGGWMPEYHSIWMSKDGGGWLILPGLKRPLSGLLPEDLEDDRAKLSADISRDREQLEKEFLESLFKRVSALNDSENEAPSEEVALKITREWRNLVVGGNIPEILSRSAVRKMPESPLSILKNLTFLVKGAAVAEVPDRVLGNHVEGRMRGISLMVDGGRGISMDCPLMVVVPTEQGPRVLIDTELYLATNKGKKMRNDNEMARLKEKIPKEDFESLGKLLDWHEKTARPQWDKWNNSVNGQQGK
ncbi:hypothetical protein GYB43_11190 [bacterium]|nr:hypothetical protein [bacterium]